MINNPCKECIVRSMCERGCDQFIEYLRKHITPYTYSALKELANQVRKGNVILHEDKKWTWV